MRARLRDEAGQSLVLVVMSMGLIVALAAFGIDVARWQVGHHRVQVTADAAALAAANCLASTRCTQTTTTGDAASQADTIANDNGIPTSNVSLSFTSTTVKATVTTTVSSAFAGFFGIPSETVTASATASYTGPTSFSFTCAVSGSPTCLSMFAANTTCPASTPTAYPIGLGVVTNDSGGGSANMTDMFTNGYYYNSASSGTYTASGPTCATDNEKKPANTTFTTVPSAVPYPAAWPRPTNCKFSAASFSTATVTADGPGVYCVTSTPASGACTSAASGTGIMNLTLSNTIPAGGYEFVGPCVILNGSSTNVAAIAGQPLVYGTSNIVTVATTKALPTCAVNDGSNGTSTWLVGNGSAIQAPIYDQCGTFDATGNNFSFTGFVEAWNINLEKNGGVVGDGPTTAYGGGTTVSGGVDVLAS